MAASAVLRDAVARLEPLAKLAGSPLVPPALGSSMRDMLADVREGARTALEEAWRRGLEDEHVAGMPAQRRVDPAARRPLVGGVRPGRVPEGGARRN